MSSTYVSMGMSLDGYVAGPNRGPANPLGDGGTAIHSWVYELRTWRERLDLPGGQGGVDDEVIQETAGRPGAYVMGKRMFEEGEANWPDPPPFRAPVFVVTHQPREPWVRKGGASFHFVTDGVESAVEQARAAAGEKDVQISGGPHVVQQAVSAGLVDDLQIHLAPLVLGEGLRLFDGFDAKVRLERDRVIDSPAVTHLRYRVVR